MTDQGTSYQKMVNVWRQRISSRGGRLALAALSTGLVLFSLVGWALNGWGVDRRSLLSSGSLKVDLKSTPPATLHELAKQFPKWSEILSDPKLESIYREFLGVYQQGGEAAAKDLAKRRGLLNEQGEVILTLELSTDDSSELARKLSEQGVRVTAASGRYLDIAIPWSLIQAIAASPNSSGWLTDPSGEPIPELEQVRRVRLVAPAGDNSALSAGNLAGDIESEGVAVMGADKWQEAGISGAGVKVGLIDSGFGGYTNLLGTELPEQVTTRSFEDGMAEVGDTDIVHGAACAEVIHDVAPGAELFLAAANSQAETMEAIKWLESQGVQVISMSKTWFAGAMDGTSDLDRFIEQSAERGVVWVIAAGNFAESHYLGEFSDSDGDGYHEFSEGNELLRIYPEQSVTLALNWDDWQVGDQDYDLYLLDGDQKVIASSENRQNGPDSGAYELINYSGLDPNGTYYVSIYAYHATRPAQLNLFVLHGKVDGSMPETSISMPAEGRLVLGIGATNWETDVLEPYSGQGPTLDGRLKPDLAAPSVVSIASSQDPFNGTSAAAPHAAGAAALVLEAYPDFTPEQVFDFLKSRAVDLGAEGPDPQFGYGRLWLGDPNERFVPPTAEPTAPAEITPPPTGVVQATARPRTGQTKPISKALPLMGLICLTVPGMFGLAGFLTLGAVVVLTRTKVEARRCPFCGEQLRQASRFCPRCGRRVR
jgi:subtilisin family serine protease